MNKLKGRLLPICVVDRLYEYEVSINLIKLCRWLQQHVTLALLLHCGQICNIAPRAEELDETLSFKLFSLSKINLDWGLYLSFLFIHKLFKRFSSYLPNLMVNWYFYIESTLECSDVFALIKEHVSRFHLFLWLMLKGFLFSFVWEKTFCNVCLLGFSHISNNEMRETMKIWHRTLNPLPCAVTWHNCWRWCWYQDCPW